MAYDFGRVPVAAEMHAFQTEVGCDQGFVAGWNAQDRAVIPNTGHDPRFPTSRNAAEKPSTRANSAANSRNQLSFG
jgi:hypothetical protein